MSKQSNEKSSKAVVNYEEQMNQMTQDIHSKISSPERQFIKTRGKVFTFPDEHQEKVFNAIVVDHVATNTYYKNPYNPNDIQPPTCFAIGENPASLVPSENAPEIQAKTCSECPLNQWGSDGKGKACKNGRLAALLAPDATADSSPLFLRVPPTSVRKFDSYVSKVASMFNKPPLGIITEVAVDETSEYLKLKFEAKDQNHNVGVVIDRLPEIKSLLLQEPDLSQAA